MIPITLITGFLGSGKTTFLKNFIQKNRDKRYIYLINEFSPVDIDGELIADETSQTVSIPGGSIFCKCLVTQFISQLSELPSRFGNEDSPIEGVVIEASGVADPRVIRQMLNETGLESIYTISSVISVTDPGTIEKLLKTLIKVRYQLEASDAIIINKTDLYSTEKLAHTENLIREINKSAQLHKSSFCDLDLDIFNLNEAAVTVEGELAGCSDPDYAELTFTFNKNLDMEKFEHYLSKYQSNIFRAKGHLLIDDQLKYIEYTQSGWDISASNRENTSKMVFIVDAKKRNDIQYHLLGYSN